MFYGGNWSNGSCINNSIGCKTVFEPTADNKNIQHQTSDIDKLSNSVNYLTTLVIILIIMLAIHMIGGH